MLQQESFITSQRLISFWEIMIQKKSLIVAVQYYYNKAEN